MGFLADIQGYSSVGLDTSIFIYEVERHPLYFPFTSALFGLLDDLNHPLHAVTSVISLLEVLIVPLRAGQKDIADIYRAKFTMAPKLQLVLLDPAIAEQAALLRAKYTWLRTPDAIQVAASMSQGTEALICNDKSWRRLTELPVLVLEDYNQL